LYTI
jgi:hypothetical protein